MRRSGVPIVAAAVLIAPLTANVATATTPPPVTVLKSAGRLAGKIFISPYGSSATYANGPEIIDGTGRVIWFKAVPAGQEAADFRVQTLYGKPVLTWWQGTGLGSPDADGVDYIYDQHYKKIGEVRAKNGYTTDG